MSPDASLTPTAVALPADLSACHALIRQLLEELQKTQQTNTRLEHYLQQVLRRLYGRSAEKIDPHQLALFEKLLAELTGPSVVTPPAAAPGATPPVQTQGNGHGRRRFAPDLPRQQIIHDLPEDQRPCPCCGTMRTKIGEEVTEKLDVTPAKLFVVQHVQIKYVCKACEAAAAETGPQIVLAEKPAAPIEKGLAEPGLLAYVIVSKYADHQPLHRLERIFARHGMELARSTLCDWAAQGASALQPLYDLMVRQVRESRVIHTDDSPVDVLDRKLDRTRTGRFWVYSGDRGHPYDVFDYTASRSRDGPMTFLKDWGKPPGGRVFLQADAFGGYDGIYRGEAGGQVTEVACWAHARRSVYEARTTDAATSTQALAYIRLLYDVEDQARQEFERQTPEEKAGRPLSALRLARRQELAVPRLAQFRQWLEGRRAQSGGPVLPKSPMGQAITYILNQWEALGVYTSDGDLAIDNNVSERALRRVAVGRANWNFCGSDAGGRTAAILFSFIATCERHRVNPFDYLRDVLTRIPAHPLKTLADLLPGRWLAAAPRPAPAASVSAVPTARG